MDAHFYIRFLVTLLYAAAAAAYLVLLVRAGRPGKIAGRLLMAALGAHLLELLARGAEAGSAGGAPFVSFSGFMSLFAFLVGVVYLFLQRKYDVPALGAFHVPAILILQAAAAVSHTPVTEVSPLKTGPLFVLHVASSAVAYAAFTVSFVVAVAFLLLERQLRKKHFGVLMRGLPSLDLVERVNAAGATIGVAFLTLGAGVGIAMSFSKLGEAAPADLKHWVTLLIILVYALQLGLRRFAGFHGRRSVVLSVVGFLIIVCGITVINLFFSPVHGMV